MRELRDELERERRRGRGSRLISVVIILVFLAAGVFYIKTARPGLWKKAGDYLKSVAAGEKSLAALSESGAPPATENSSGESGDMLLTADNLSFSYLPEGGVSALSRAVPSAALPVMNATVTSRFGSRTDPLTGQECAGHHGIDLAASPGSGIFACRGGVVTSVAQTEVYGNCVTLSHAGGLESFYGHMSSVCVEPGQRVDAGERIGVIGSTGRSTGVHLHFEIRENGERVDPAPYLYEEI